MRKQGKLLNNEKNGKNLLVVAIPRKKVITGVNVRVRITVGQIQLAILSVKGRDQINFFLCKDEMIAGLKRAHGQVYEY